MRDMTHSYFWHAFFKCVTYLLHITVDCTWSVVFSFSNLKQWSSLLGFLCHVRLKRDQWDWGWRFRLNHTPLGCSFFFKSKHYLLIFIRVTWLIHMCDMTRPYECHDRHDSFMYVISLIHMCDMTHSNVLRASYIRTFVWYICTYIHFCRDQYQLVFIRVICLIHRCDLVYLHIYIFCRDQYQLVFIRVLKMSLIHRCENEPHSQMWPAIFERI